MLSPTLPADVLKQYLLACAFIAYKAVSLLLKVISSTSQNLGQRIRIGVWFGLVYICQKLMLSKQMALLLKQFLVYYDE